MLSWINLSYFQKNGFYIGRPFPASAACIFTRLDQQVTRYPAYTDVKVISVDTGRLYEGWETVW